MSFLNWKTFPVKIKIYINTMKSEDIENVTSTTSLKYHVQICL